MQAAKSRAFAHYRGSLQGGLVGPARGFMILCERNAEAAVVQIDASVMLVPVAKVRPDHLA